MEYLSWADIENLKRVAVKNGYEALIGKIPSPRLAEMIGLDMFIAKKEFSAVDVTLINEILVKLLS